ncbi:synaptotagmin-15-like [Pollicipes pollicipes]|uniref:synaptotagmin-15-like n=1 Tax=Pollicipes pollicipes TaxID=41117 RepID=UPI001884A828|nr:synaptotagmin-15-like [Pollicipes pollicipes]
MAFCAQLCQKLSELCCPRQEDDKSEKTLLTVKCHGRYASDENLLESGDPPAVHKARGQLSRSEPDVASLSACETQLDRVQPPAERLYRPDLDSQLSLNEFGSVPDITVTSSDGAPRTFLSRKLQPEVMRHAQTIADISKHTLRDLKSRNRADAGADATHTFARASRLGFDRAQYESAGSLTHDAPSASAAAAAADVDDSHIVEEVYGTVSLSVSFNPHMKRLLVQLEAVHNLPTRGDGHTYDAATELTLLPDAKPVKKAPVAVGELNPRYNIDYALPLRSKELRHKTLRVTVMDAARRGPYEAVGHGLLSLQSTVSESPERYVLPLARRSLPSEPLGRLLVSLSYRPADDRLSVVVMQARGLRVSPAVHHLPQKTFEKHARYDTFVKASLRCAGEKVKTRRSPVLAGSRDPFYNAGFSFVLPQGFVDDASLVVSVVMRGPMRTDLVIGRVILGPFFSHAAGQPTQWGRALTGSEVATQWHRLYL